MAIYRGAGGAGDAINDSSSEASAAVIARDEAVAAKVAAEAARDAALTAETNAETAETNAETAETNAETAASNALTSANNASNSAVSAASSASAASSSASSASTSATNAANSSTTAAGSASAAAISATAASNSASSASGYATTASNAATSASASAASATASEAAALASKNAAATSETNAASSASTANSAATTATTQAGIATTQATNASNSASAAATSATNASNSASAAATSASNAATSATSAQSAQAAAESARDATLTAYDNFDDRYLGSKTSDPTLDNDGNALVAGTLYFNSVDGVMKLWTGSIWTAAYVSGAGVLLQANNLSDLNNVASARTNLGLGTAATTDSTAYATAAQGATADTAYADRLKWDGGATGLVAATGRTSLGLGTAATTAATDYATAAQGAKADTALQPAAIGVTVQGYDADTAKLDVSQSWSAAQSFNAGVTLGDASGDALTINSSAVSIPNGLNFDSNTLFIDSANNRVGIGTASPTQNLTVSGGGLNTTDGTVSLVVSQVSSVGLVGTATNHPLALYANGAERMRITSTGNVGIGVASPTYRLQVVAADNASDDDTLTLGFSFNANSAQMGSIGTHNTDSINGGLKFSTQIAGALTEKMRITSAGNVMIGNTSYAQRLSVAKQSDGIIGYFRRDGATINPALTINANETGNTVGFSTDYAGATSPAMTFTTQATERMRIDSSGNVGIGTNSPIYPLQVGSYTGSTTTVLAVGSTTEGRLSFGDGTSGVDANAGGLRYFHSSDAMAFYTAATERMRIDSSGNLGLGVTPSAWTDYKVVQLGGAGAVASDGVYTTELLLNAYYSTGFKYKNTAAAARYSVTNGQHQWFNAPSGTAGTAITFTQAMTLDASGNLGVGTTSPNTKLRVLGSDTTVFAVSGATKGIRFDFDSTQSTIYGVDNTLYSSYQPLRIGGSITQFMYGGAEAMRIDTSGILSVGTTATVADINVPVQLNAASGAQKFFGVNRGGSYGLLLGYDYSNDIARIRNIANTAMTFETNNVERMRIDSSGNVGIGTSSLTNKLEVAGGIRLSTSTATIPDYGLRLLSGLGTQLTSAYQMSFYVNGSERMFISESGNLGLGVTPSDTIGYGRTLDMGAASGAVIYLRDTDAPTSQYGLIAYDGNDNGLKISNQNSGGYVRFSTAATERMRIDSSGNVGIGISSPNGRLNVVDSSANAVQIRVDNTSQTAQYLSINMMGATAFGVSDWVNSAVIEAVANGGQSGTKSLYFSAYNGPIIFATNARTERFRIGTAGQLGIGGANYGTSGQVLTSNGSGAAPSWADAGGAVKAWVNFNGTNGSIRASSNVSSVTRNSAGNYTINLSTAMSDTNYSCVSDTNNGTSTGTSTNMRSSSTRPLTTSTIGMYTFPNDASGTINDSDINGFALFR